MRRASRFGGIATLLATALTACEAGVSEPTDGALAAIEIVPQTAQVELQTPLQLEAVLRDASGSRVNGRRVFWSTEDTTIAVVSSTGLVTGRTTGRVRVAASSEGMDALMTLTVVPRAVVTVTLTPARVDLVAGGSARLVAVARDRTGAALEGRSVGWESADAAVARVDADGTVTAVRTGSTTIRATVEGQSASAVVAVVPVPVAAVELTPTAGQLTVGGTLQLRATPRAADGATLADRVVTWSSSHPTVVAVSASGLATALAPGSATITATVEGRSATAQLMVAAVPVASVEVQPATVRLTPGASQQFSAILRAADGAVLTGRALGWTTSDPAIATVNAAGVVTAVGVGQAVIRATSEGRQGAGTVVVEAPTPVASVAVSPATARLAVGTTIRLEATTFAANGAVLTGRAVSWSSNNTAVATVDAGGVVTTRTAGQVTITAISEGRQGAAAITVDAPAPPPPTPVATVDVAPAAATLIPGETRQLTATLRAADGSVLTGRVVTWSSSNAAVATVDASGRVTAVAVGQATITATSEGRTGSAAVTVQAPPPVPVATVDVTPTTATLQVGGTQAFSAVARAADGTVLTGRAIGWSSSNPAVATVDASGLVTALLPGQATITASTEGRQGTAAVTVQVPPPPPPPVVATVEVTPAQSTLAVGGTRQLTAVARAADGSTLTGRPVVWRSSNLAVATVSETGLVTGVAAGQATVTATVEGISGASAVTVEPPPPPPPTPVATVDVAPAAATLIPGETRQLTATLRAADGSVLTGRVVTWSSSNAAVATVDASGRVTAVAVGQATITATSEGRTGSAAVTVQAPPPVPVATVNVTPATSTLQVGASQTFNATTRAADGTVLTGRVVTWSSSNAAVATVDASGRVTAVAAGQATITATSEGKTGSATVTVQAPQPVPTRLVIVSGDNQSGRNNQALSSPLVVRVLDQNGQPVAGVTVQWSTNNGQISPATSVTGADGTASASWTLGGGGSDIARRAFASVAGLATVEFTATRE